jgi:hypothetical protein
MTKLSERHGFDLLSIAEQIDVQGSFEDWGSFRKFCVFLGN